MSARATIRAGVKVRVVGVCMNGPFLAGRCLEARAAVAQSRRRRAGYEVVPAYDAASHPSPIRVPLASHSGPIRVLFGSYLRRTRRAGGVHYVQGVGSFWSLVRRYGFDALIVLAAIESTLEVVLRHDSP